MIDVWSSQWSFGQRTLVWCDRRPNLENEKFLPILDSRKLGNILSYKLRCYTRISSPDKSRNNTREKKTIFFHVCLILPISCWHFTRLSRHSVRLMNERQSLHHSLSMVVCRNIFGLWLLKNWNIHIDAFRQWRWNFPRKEDNQNTKWKTESYVFSDFGNGISRGWEQKSTTGRFARGRLWLFTWMISSVGKDHFNTWEFCILKLGPLFVFVVIQRMFSSWVRQRTLRFFFFGDCRSFYFHSLIESTFLDSKGLLCLYDKQNNTRLLVDMKFLFSWSTRHLELNARPCIILHLIRSSVTRPFLGGEH